MNNNIDIKDLVVIDRIEYEAMLIYREKIDRLNKELIKEMEIFKNYFINDILQNETYALSHIENYDLEDYYVCQMVIKFFEKGITDLEFIFKAIKEYNYKEEGVK